MISIETDYKAEAIFSEDKSTTWDKLRNKTFKFKIFGLTVFKRQTDLKIDYESTDGKRIGFKK